jgi:hypothetical protein
VGRGPGFVQSPYIAAGVVVVINPRSMAVLIRDRANQFKDRTQDTSRIRIADQRIEIVFNDSNKSFRYGWDRVRILRDPRRRALMEGERVEVNGSAWKSPTEVLTFTDADGAWSRIFYRTQAGEAYTTYPASQVRVITSATETRAVADVLGYWRAVVSFLPATIPCGLDTKNSFSFTPRAHSILS